MATPIVSSILLPDGRSYQFTYEQTIGVTGGPYYTGRIASITLPTGGTITYTYTDSSGTTGDLLTPQHNPINCSDGSALGLKRVTPDSPNPTKYTRSGTGTHWTTTVVDPLNNQTSIDFQQASDKNFYETKRQTPRDTVDTCYNGNTTQSTCTTTAITTPVSRSVVWTTFGSKVSRKDSFYNSNGLPTEVDDYDFGSGTATRKTIISYNSSLTNGIKDRPASVTVNDGSGNLKAQTTYGYDEYGVTRTTGTPNQVSITGSRGNLTSIHRRISSGGSATLNQTFTYFDTGNLKSATDVNAAVTSYEYNSTNCANSLLTKVTLPVVNGLAMTRLNSWNCTGGVVTSSTDENGNSVSASYSDSYFWRPISSSDPMSNTTNFGYSNSGVTQVESSLTFNGSSSVVNAVVTSDSMGRPRLRQSRQSPNSSTYDSTQIDYDALGRVWQQYVPFPASKGSPTDAFKGTTTTYDEIGRPASVSDSGTGYVTLSYTDNDIYQEIGPIATGETKTKDKQLEYDGLGRLTSVCEITSGSGSGTCAQTTSRTGYWTTYTYDTLGNLTGVTQNAQATAQTRSFSFDALSRLTSESNPENGTTNYTYDSDPTCGTSNGDLVKRIDQMGNTTCYAYDALHRLTALTYPNGPYASSTPQKHFVYDTATITLGPSNMLQNAAFEGGLAGWRACTGGTSSVINNPSQAHDGNNYLQLTTTTGSCLMSDYYLAVKPGETIQFGGWAYRGAGGSGAVRWKLVALDADLSVVTYPSAAPDATTASWTPQLGTYTIPQNVYYVRPYVEIYLPTGATTARFDGGYVNRQSSAYTTVNTKGRLAEAYTGTSASKITDLAFSYNARGEVTDSFQSSPNSGGYYHVNSSYWANGIAHDLTGIPGVPTIFYGVDGQGRLATVTSTAEQNTNLVQSTTYNVASQPTDVILGSNDSDHYTYDPDTGRMAQYKFTIGSTPQDLKGDFVWNPNGSLASLTISDPFNLGNNQTCNYTHDDLGRIKKVDCGTIWTQNFTFDAFGNINKSVPVGSSGINFLPTYNTSNNRIATVPGAPNPGYDNNGNLTSITDGSSHTYTWDAEGRPVAIDGKNVTYDASGRAVEFGTTGAYTQVLYGLASEKLALMTGQSLQKAFIALPSGTAVYTSSGLSYYRHSDWLGSSRFGSTTTRTMYSDLAYAPYGEPYVEAGTTDRSFTGQNQDTVSGLYDFLYRRLNPVQGRWIFPDPSGVSAVDLALPQTWNRYAYVANRPVKFVDPLGLNLADGDCTDDWFASSHAECPFPPGDGGGGGGGIDIGWGDGGGGGGTGGPPRPSPPLNGERLGIPANLKFPNATLLSLLIPSMPHCDFGPCVELPTDFQGAGPKQWFVDWSTAILTNQTQLGVDVALLGHRIWKKLNPDYLPECRAVQEEINKCGRDFAHEIGLGMIFAGDSAPSPEGASVADTMLINCISEAEARHPECKDILKVPHIP